jgi:hypothetical protein|tara:strand:+ start:4337 stop:4597 length:261 start_codon:yes stop_codon:yes gene_type:complete
MADEMDRDLEDVITGAMLELLIDAKERGMDLLSFEQICELLGVDDISLMSGFESGMNFELNDEFLDKLKDPEIRRAMLESFKATKH